MQARRDMTWAAVAALAVAIGLVPSSFRQAPSAGEFLTAIEDLPLMPGLAEDHGAGLAFDKPGGRVVEAFAFGAVDRAAVLRFYAETLPGLGWRVSATPRTDKSWRREDEALDLDIVGEGPPLIVRFYLTPN